MNNIAHEMSSGHSSMGEYPRAISPPVVLHPVIVSPSDVVPLRRLVSQTTYHFSDDSVADADSITDEPSHTSTPSPTPHNYEVRQIQTRVWKAHVTADTAEEAKKKAWSSSRGWTSASDDVVLEAAIDVDAANDQRMHTYTHKWNKHLSARHLSDTEQGITAAFPEVTGDGAKPYHDCRTAGCRRQAPGPFPPSVCGIRELHCCVHCYDTNGTRHSRECETYTADNPTCVFARR